MFKANAILTSLKTLLESQLNSELKISVQSDMCQTLDATSFDGGVSIVIVSANADAPESSTDGFNNSHLRTLNLRFEIRALGLPAQLSIEPIAQAVSDVIYAEHKKLGLGTSVLQGLVLGFGLPTLSYDGVLQSDAAFAGAALDIPATYQSTFPI